MPPTVVYRPLPFVREVYRPGSRVADILLRQGEQAAEAERRRGEIAGQMWSNLGQTIGQTIAGVPRAMQEARQAQEAQADRALQRTATEQQIRANQARVAEAEAAQAAAARQAQAQQMAPSALVQGEDGLFRYDEAKLRQSLGESGLGDFADTILDSQNKFLANTLAVRKAESEALTRKREALSSLAFGALMGGGTMNAAAHAAQLAEANQLYGKDEIEQAIGQATDETMPNVLQSLLSPEDAKRWNDIVIARTPKPVNEPQPSQWSIRLQAAGGDAKEALRQYQAEQDAAGRRTPTLPRPITETAEASLITRLNKQWTDASKPARELDRQLGLMDAGLAAAKRGDLAQGAQAVLVTFQKILDPPSVVRESEYMRSAAGLSLANRVKGAVEQLQRGGAGVPLNELEKFAQLAREAASAQKTNYLPEVKARLGKTADRYRLPHELIFDYEPMDEAPTQTLVNPFPAPKGRR